MLEIFADMTSINRSSSWQEEVAKNFTRWFSRSKSEDENKTNKEGAEKAKRVNENEPQSPSTQAQENNEFSKVLQGTEGNNSIKEDKETNTVKENGGMQDVNSNSNPKVAESNANQFHKDTFLQRLEDFFNFLQKSSQGDQKKSYKTTDDTKIENSPNTDTGKEALHEDQGEKKDTNDTAKGKAFAENCSTQQDMYYSLSDQQEGVGESGYIDPCSQSTDTGESEHEDSRNTRDPAKRQSGSNLSEPSTITRATYRGSRQIRKLKKKRAHVDSAIPEGGEDALTLPANKENHLESKNQHTQNGFHEAPQIIVELEVNGHLPVDNTDDVNQPNKCLTVVESLESPSEDAVSSNGLLISQNGPVSPTKNELVLSTHESPTDIKNGRIHFSFLSDQNVSLQVGETDNRKDSIAKEHTKYTPSETQDISSVNKPLNTLIKNYYETKETSSAVDDVNLMKNGDISSNGPSIHVTAECYTSEGGQHQGEETNMVEAKECSTIIVKQSIDLKDEGNANALNELHPENNVRSIAQDDQTVFDYQDVTQSFEGTGKLEDGEVNTKSNENSYSSLLSNEKHLPAGNYVETMQEKNIMMLSMSGRESSQNIKYSKSRSSGIYDSILEHRRSIKTEKKNPIFNRYSSVGMPDEQDCNELAQCNQNTSTEGIVQGTVSEKNPTTLDMLAQNIPLSPGKVYDENTLSMKINEVKQSSAQNGTEAVIVNSAKTPLSSSEDKINHLLLNFAEQRVREEMSFSNVSDAGKLSDGEQSTITVSTNKTPLSSSVDEIVHTLLNLAKERIKEEINCSDVNNASAGWLQTSQADANNESKSTNQEATDRGINLEKERNKPPLMPSSTFLGSDKILADISLLSKAKNIVDEIINSAIERVTIVLPHSLENDSEDSGVLKEQPNLIEKHDSLLKTAQTLTDENENSGVKNGCFVPASSLSNTVESMASSKLQVSCPSPVDSKDETTLYQKESKPWSAFVGDDDDDDDDDDEEDDDADNYVSVTAVKVFVDPELEDKDLTAPESVSQVNEDSIPVEKEGSSNLCNMDGFKGNRSMHEMQAHLTQKQQPQHSDGSKVYYISNEIKKERFPIPLDSIPEEPKQCIRILTDEDMGDAIVVTAVKVNIDPDMEEEMASSSHLSPQSDKHNDAPTSLTVLSEVSLENQKGCISQDETDNLPRLPFCLSPPHHELPSDSSATTNTEYSSEQHHENKNTVEDYLQNYDPELLLNPDSRQHKMYPLSLSPIPEDFFEDDSSIEDVLPEILTTKKIPDEEKQSPSKSLSVLELLQSVSEHLKLCNLANEKDYSQEKPTQEPLISSDDLPQHIGISRHHQPSTCFDGNHTVTPSEEQLETTPKRCPSPDQQHEQHSQEKPAQVPLIASDDCPQHVGISQDHQASTCLDDNHTITSSDEQLEPSPKKGPSPDQQHFSDAWHTQQDQMSSHSTENKEMETNSNELALSHVVSSNDTYIQINNSSQPDYSNHYTLGIEQAPQDIPPKMIPKSTLQSQDKGTQSVLYRYLQGVNYLNNSDSEKKFGLDKVSLLTVFESDLDWLIQSKGTSKDHSEAKNAEISLELTEIRNAKVNPRPGKMVIYNGLHNGGSKQEILSDVHDASSWQFPAGVTVRVIRGCWLLYKKPEYQGEKYLLEEGETSLKHFCNESSSGVIIIGSIKQAVKDHSIPEIMFFQEANSEEPFACLHSKVPSLKAIQPAPSSVAVMSGIWLAYTDDNFQGQFSILEQGQSTAVVPTGVRSLCPVKMGGLKVQMPLDPKIILYDKPHFEGQAFEVSENVYSITTLPADRLDKANKLEEVGSVQVIGGVWVAYEKEGYRGHQYLLEEGAYEDWKAWGGVNPVLMSLRFLQGDFLESSVTLFEDIANENGKRFDISNQEIPNLNAGTGCHIGSICVNSGVWVAYDQKYFSGEQYILEKGIYKNYLEWGGVSDTILSIRPIQLEEMGTKESLYMVKCYSMPDFKGTSEVFLAETSSFPSLSPKSFKVVRGCWLLYDTEDFTGNCYILEEGHYADFSAFGCLSRTIKSLKPIQHVSPLILLLLWLLYDTEDFTGNCYILEEGHYADFSAFGCLSRTIKSLKPIQHHFGEPTVELFSLDSYEGRSLHVEAAVNSLLSEVHHFHTRSLWVKCGLWIAYEGDSFRGRQMLLEPIKIPDWSQHSSWNTIGSLRPVNQPKVYLRIRNQAQGTFLTAGKILNEKSTKVTVCPHNGSSTQIWYYNCGLIKSKATKMCLDIIGGQDTPGSKVALCIENRKARQRWSIKEDGTISSLLNDALVLAVKGGDKYDKDHVIIRQLLEGDNSHLWEIEVL
ncbi:uncharacterized protein LOC122802163 [Protopterus annectens]|uniref:uncharacterized protein LOC122802163 n=1 Tax=Protopterus annectens TaxID=7888 RepID=UPI001CF96B43|nr:uncharacterized protein LOC122802163 [Protopterus annectens]